MGIAEGTGGRWAPAGFGLLGDERLARLAATGHERAFAVVYERHHQAIYRYCRSILRHDADAQDALQSTFAAAFGALARGQRDAPIRPWLFRIAHNESVSLLRRRRPTAELSAASDASSSSVEDQVAERAELHALLADLRKLTERQRSALVMRELSGLSHEEIAIALGISVGAAKQTIYEARRSLFEFAEGRAMDCDEVRKTVSDADGRALRSRRVRTHLRECSPCRSFADAIPARGADLRALAPAMPMLAAAGVLERIAGATTGHSVGGGAGLAGAAVGKTAGAALTANALAGAAVVASATIGVTTGVGRLVHAENHPRAHHRAAPISAPAPRTHGASVLGRPAGSVARARVRLAHPGHASSATATSTSVVRRRASASAGSHTSSRAPVGAGSSAVATTTGPGTSAIAPGHKATGPGHFANAPGHSATGPGNSANAPGHSTAGPGNSANAPGHLKAAPGHMKAGRGNSANAPGHATTTRAGNAARAPGHSVATSPGNAATAPGHLQAGRPTASAPSATAPFPAQSAVTDSAPATAPGRAGRSPAPSKKTS